MSWILIVILFHGPNPDGFSIEFKTRDACLNAASELLNVKGAGGAKPTKAAICVPAGK